MVSNNPKYSSLIITSLLFMCMILALASIKLHSDKVKHEELYAVEYVEPEINDEGKKLPENIALNNTETHRAYNEAADFINKIEQNRAQEDLEFDKRIDALDEAIAEGFTVNENSKSDVVLNLSQKKIETKKTEKSNNRNSTNSYRLVDREALFFPNPVYLCDAGGRIVITITVDNSGHVIEAYYATSLSDTTNECLIYEALNYARRSTFSTSIKPSQMGTITYNFQNQN